MTESDIEALSRAHQLFAGSTRQLPLDAYVMAPLNSVVGQESYQSKVNRSQQVLRAAARTDAAATEIIAGAHRDRAQARQLTKNVLDEARADAAATPITPMAQREAMRRRAARLCAQRARIDRPVARPTAFGGAAGAALPNAAPPWTAVAVPEQSCRNCGARGAVPTGPPLRMGCDRPRSVRLFRTRPVVLCAGRHSPGPHHLSADQRRNSRAPFASQARRSGLPAHGTRADGDRQQPRRRSTVFGCLGAHQPAGQLRRDSAAVMRLG